MVSDVLTDRVTSPVALIFNSAVAAPAISAAWEIGALDRLRERGSLDIDDFAAERGLDPLATIGVFRALGAVDIVQRDGTAVTPGVNFAEAHRNRSFFHWLTRGSAELFRRLPELLPQRNRIGDFYQRDAEAVAYACREISAFTYDPWFWKAVDSVDFPVRTVADLGCGSGARLIQLLTRFPEAWGLGVDIAPAALRLAAREMDAAGLANRVNLVRADVLTMAADSQTRRFPGVDLVTCFMMGHDFWPREQCLQTLRQLREVFPDAQRFLLGDATRTVGVADRDLPVFTLGFELAHDLMGTFIPTMADWESVFEHSDWQIVRTHAIGVAVGEVIFELAPR